MNFYVLFKKIASISVFTSIIVFSVSLGFSLYADKVVFGKYSYYQSFLMVLMNIIPFGTTMSFVIFLHQFDKRKYSRLVSVGLYVIIPSVALMVSILVNILNQAKIIKILYIDLMALLVVSLFASLSLAVISYFRSTQNMRIYGSIFLMYTVVFSVTPFATYIISNNLSISYVVTGLLLFITSIFYIRLMKKHIDISPLINFVEIRWGIKYGLPVVLSSLGMSLMVIGDKLLLGTLYGWEQLSAYSVGALISSTVLFLVNNYASAWGVFLSKNIGANVELRLSYISARKKLVYLILIYPLVLLVQLAFYSLFFEKKYPNLEIVIIILTSAYFIYFASKFFMGYMNYYRKNSSVLMSCLIALVIAITSFIAINSSNRAYIMSFSVMMGMLAQLIFCLLYTNNMIAKKV